MDHCFLVSSGKAALTLTLRVLQRANPERCEIIVPGYTCFSVPSSIVRAGLRLRPCDIDLHTLDFHMGSLAEALEGPSSRRVLAVLPVHLFGLPADVEIVRSLSPDEVWVVEDAAQGMGGLHASGKKLGTLGDVGFFSLGRGKAMSTLEGGIVLTNRSDVGREMERDMASVQPYSGTGILSLMAKTLALMLFLHPRLFWLPRSLPWLRLGETIYDPGFPVQRMSPFQAGLARHWKRKLERLVAVRREKARAWIEVLKEHACSRSLIVPPAEDTNLVRLPLMAPDRAFAKRLQAWSERNGMGIMPGYPFPLDRLQAPGTMPPFRPCPASEEAADRLLTLPLHAHVRRQDMVRTAEAMGRLATHSNAADPE